MYVCSDFKHALQTPCPIQQCTCGCSSQYLSHFHLLPSPSSVFHLVVVQDSSLVVCTRDLKPIAAIHVHTYRTLLSKVTQSHCKTLYIRNDTRSRNTFCMIQSHTKMHRAVFYHLVFVCLSVLHSLHQKSRSSCLVAYCWAY